LLKDPSDLALNSSREGAATASLGNLFCCLATFIIKTILPHIQYKSTLFQLKTIVPCPVATGPDEKSLSVFLISYICPMEAFFGNKLVPDYD